MKREETSSNGGEVESSGSGEGEGGVKVGDTVTGANGKEAGEGEGEARTATNGTRKPAEVSVHHISLSCSHGVHLTRSLRDDVWTVDNFWTTPPSRYSSETLKML